MQTSKIGLDVPIRQSPKVLLVSNFLQVNIDSVHQIDHFFLYPPLQFVEFLSEVDLYQVENYVVVFILF